MSAQLSVPRVEQAVQVEYDNNKDTVRVFNGTIGLNLSQTALENWAGGGESSVAFTALSQLGKTIEKGPRSASWGVDAALGLLRQQGGWRKTDDRIVVTGQWNAAMRSSLNGGRLSLLLDARTQFLPGYAVVDGLPDRSQRISDFLSPGYLVAAAGFAPKKGERHQFFLAPFTGKLTVLLDDTLFAAGAFGVPAGQTSRLELGGYLRWNLKWPLMENVTWTHQVDLFSNYLDSPGNIDINWTGLLELEVNESLRTTISTHLIYDDDVVLEKEPARTETNDQGVVVAIPARLGPGTQFKEVLALRGLLLYALISGTSGGRPIFAGMKVMVFPGQGAQFPGMGQDLHEAHAFARDRFAEAADVLGFDIADIMFNGSDEDLKQTKVTQPAIFLHSVIMAEGMGDAFNPDFVAGHSLGEFSALVAAGGLGFAEGLKLVSERAQAMQAACEATPSTMAAILGMEDADVEALCAGTEGIVVAANYNCPGQLVISGEVPAIEAACEQLKEAGARRALVLPVGGAFHSPLMEPARERLARALEAAELNAPRCPIVQNVTATPETNPEVIRQNLIAQLTAPVRWTQTMQWLLFEGVNDVVEVGPGKVLQGLFKKVDRGLATASAVVA